MRVGSIAVARDHREVARREVSDLPRQLDANADLHRAPPDVVHARAAGQILPHVGHVPHDDLVHRSRDDARVGHRPVRVVQRGVGGEAVQHLEQQPEAQVARDRLLQHHEAASQVEIAREGQHVLTRSVVRSHGARSWRRVVEELAERARRGFPAKVTPPSERWPEGRCTYRTYAYASRQLAAPFDVCRSSIHRDRGGWRWRGPS